MRCYICNYCGDLEDEPDLVDGPGRRRVSIQRDGKPVCTQCIQAVKEHHYSLPPLGEVDNPGKAADISAMIEELEHRIPDLFVGPVCPLEFTRGDACSCTYETGCMALKNKDNNVTEIHNNN
jgi:hypothetical protein